MSGQLHVPVERSPDTHYIGKWMGPKTDIDAVAKKKKSFPPPCRELMPVVQPEIWLV
jgi:hypothetical protein